MSNRLSRNGRLVFDVTKYGATGNGTTDDTAAINAAISDFQTAAVTPGAFNGTAAKLYFPAGRYAISSMLNVKNIAGGIICGDGMWQTSIVGGFASMIQSPAVLRLTSCQYTTTRDLTITGYASVHTLTSDLNAGSNTTTISSAATLAIGQKIAFQRIDLSYAETAIISNISGTTITLKFPVQNSYIIGDYISNGTIAGWQSYNDTTDPGHIFNSTNNICENVSVGSPAVGNCLYAFAMDCQGGNGSDYLPVLAGYFSDLDNENHVFSKCQTSNIVIANFRLGHRNVLGVRATDCNLFSNTINCQIIGGSIMMSNCSGGGLFREFDITGKVEHPTVLTNLITESATQAVRIGPELSPSMVMTTSATSSSTSLNVNTVIGLIENVRLQSFDLTVSEDCFVSSISAGSNVSGKSGTTATISSVNGSGVATLTGVSGFSQGDIGTYISISNASNSNNNGPTGSGSSFIIYAVNSSTSISYYNPSAVAPDANNGSIHWQQKYPALNLANGIANSYTTPNVDGYYAIVRNGAYQAEMMITNWDKVGGQTAPNTQLVADASSGATSITVSNPFGMYPGRTIAIGGNFVGVPGPVVQEVNTVHSVSGITVSLRSPITNSYFGTTKTGTSATFSSLISTTVTLTGGSGFVNGVVGSYVTISNAATGANNGTFLITAFNSATSISYTNANVGASATDANNGSIHWSIGPAFVGATDGYPGYLFDVQGSNTTIHIANCLFLNSFLFQAIKLVELNPVYTAYPGSWMRITNSTTGCDQLYLNRFGLQSTFNAWLSSDTGAPIETLLNTGRIYQFSDSNVYNDTGTQYLEGNFRGVRGISRPGSIACNTLAGTITFTTSSSGFYGFGTLEADTNYQVVIGISNVTGTPAAGAYQIASVTKYVDQVVITLVAAPGGGNSITYNFIMYR